MPSRAVYLVISCDVDPDRERLLDGIPSGTLTWRGMTEGIPAVKSLLRGLSDSRGREPAFTWLLRADRQIRQVCGEYGWVPRTYRSFLQSLQESGDEIGWHPHFWRRDTRNGSWFQEIEDVDWQVEMLRKAHTDLATCFLGAPKSVRMGWGYHNNRTYHTLEDLGVAVDLSAVPGYRTLTGKPPGRSENLFDWHSTPRTSFRPSRVDYRRAARAGESSSEVLEVPSFVSASVPWSLVSGLQLARKTGDLAQLWYAVRRPTYCINVTARPVFFAPLVAQLRRALRQSGSGPLVFSTQCHADELVPNRSRLYNIDSVQRNLAALLRACSEADTPVEFVQARQIPALCPN